MIRYALALLFVSNVAWAAGFEPPAYERPVMDNAGLLSAEVAQQMSIGLEQLYREGGSQIGVLTVDSLNGDTIEAAGIKTADKWKLGTAKGDNGAILLISKGDRAMRIEVGQGLEGVLTDLHSKRIIEDVIVPRFKSGEFEQGIIEGVVTIMKHTDPEKNLSTLASGYNFPSAREARFNAGDIPWLSVLLSILFQHPVLLIFALFIFLRLLGGGGRRSKVHRGWSSGGWGGGGFGGGSFGGGGGFGGFSGGGGGGFSGGGASGRW